MSLITKKRKGRRQKKRPPRNPFASNFQPVLSALHCIRKQSSLKNIDMTRSGPNPSIDHEDHPEEYERYRGKVSARVLMHLACAVPEMRSVSFQNCQRIDRTMLRALSTGKCSESITGLNLSNSSLNNDSIQVLAHFSNLQDLDLSQTDINDGALQWVVEGSFRTLRLLALSKCDRITDVGIEWIAGMCGFSPKPCRHIRMVDLGHCKRIGDRAMRALGYGCPLLQSLNLEHNTCITDHGIDGLTKGCRKIRVLNLRRLGQLSSFSLQCIGNRCPELRSICVDYCVYMDDVGVEKMAKGCPKIECASFAGCLRMSERSVCAIAEGCVGIMALNVTGCQGVTENGLRNLCLGNGFLQVATSYFGLKPIRDCGMMKVRAMEKDIVCLAATKIQSVWQSHQGRKYYKQQYYLLKEIPAIVFIQTAYRKYVWRKVIQHWLLMCMTKRAKALQIQTWYRIKMEITWAMQRYKNKLQKEEYIVLLAKMQSMYRGKKARRVYPCREVPDHFEWLRQEAIKLRLYKAAKSIQDAWMRKLHRTRFIAKCEEMNQRKNDIKWGCLAIQCSWRCCVSRARLTYLREQWAIKMAIEIAATLFIQRVWRGKVGRDIAKQKRHDREVLYLIKVATATKLQGCFRGWMSRKSSIMLLNVKIIAATKIQALWRMYSCPGIAVWATRMAKQRIFFNSEVEQKQRLIDAAKTREDFTASLLKDSASESDEADDWCEFWNDEKDAPFWYSDEHRVTTFYNPYERKFELSLVGKKCKVRWPRGLDERARHDEWGNLMKPKYPMKEGDVEVWYDGIILQYHVDKDKHRIYFTGSMQKNRPPDVVYNRDWVCLKLYPHRVQIQVDIPDEPNEEGPYCLYNILASDMKKEHREDIEMRRRERNGEGGGGGGGGEDAGGGEGEMAVYAADDESGEWTTHIDEESGASYQYNSVTGESVWDEA